MVDSLDELDSSLVLSDAADELDDEPSVLEASSVT